MSLFSELKRRNVIKVAVAYIIVAWLLLQVADTLGPALRLPDWFVSGVTFVLIIGFPLALIFAWAFELTPEGLKLEREVDREQSITRRTGRKLDVITIALLAAALVYFAFDKFVLAPTREAAQVEAALQARPQASAEPGPSIAVLPFVNMSGDPEQEYFSDGISEELLNVLAQYHDLRVAARTSSFQFKGKSLDVSDIARQLHVNHVLEGSVRKAGNRLRITAQLIDSNKGFHVWSQVYDRELGDVFAIQQEISTAIGRALQVELSLQGGENSLPIVREAANPEAFEDYLRGRQLINQRGKESIEQALGPLQQALQLDERYAPAHAQLAIAYLMLANSASSYGDWPIEDSVVRAQPHIQRALDLDANLAEAYGARGLLDTLYGRGEQAEQSLRQALELNPSYIDALNWLFIALTNQGKHREAVETLDRLMAIDPLSIIGRGNYAPLLAVRGQVAEAHAMAQSILAQTPRTSFTTHGMIDMDITGEVADALGWFLKAYALQPTDGFANGYLCWIFGLVDLMPEAMRLREDRKFWAYYGHRDLPQAIAALQTQLETDPDNPFLLMQQAHFLQLSGDLRQAQPIYEKLLAQSGGGLLYDTSFGTVLPTAQAALGRLRAGDRAGGEALLRLAREDLHGVDAADRRDGWYYRTLAVVQAIDGDANAALQSIGQALDHGHRDPNLFEEPAFEALKTAPEFAAQRQRLDAILAGERKKILAMLCADDWDTSLWQPLPETCAGL